jgi:hypothetical protein
MTVPKYRDVGAADIARWRRERGSPSPAESAEARVELPKFRPARPEAVFDRAMDQLQAWARADKEAWGQSIALFRKQNGTATAHMTDEQLYDMLRAKIEESIKRSYHRKGRAKELQIKTGGF